MLFADKIRSEIITKLSLEFNKASQIIASCRYDPKFSQRDVYENGEFKLDGSIRQYLQFHDGEPYGDYKPRTWKIADTSVGELFLYEKPRVVNNDLEGIVVEDSGELDFAFLIDTMDALMLPVPVGSFGAMNAVPLDLLAHGVDGLKALHKKYLNLLPS